jgi:hypothetical protein
VVRAMFRDIEADCYIMADGDDTYPAEYAREMADLVLLGQADMVVGDRLSTTYFKENKRPLHGGGNVLVRKLVNRLFKGDVTDIMSGYRAFSPMFVKSYPVVHQGFEIETDMTIFALDKNLLIRAVPVTYRDRPEGSKSKLNTLRDGFRIIKTIMQLFKDYRPLSFFGLISLALMLAGFGFFIPVLVEYIQTGLVARFPTLFMSLFLILAAINLFCCGLTLNTVAENNRKTAELHFLLIREKYREK